MQPEEFFEEVCHFRFSAVADEFVRSEAVDFISGKAQLAIC